MKTKIKLIGIMVAVLSVLAFFVTSFYLQKNVLPEQIKKVQVNLNVPVRYAFITDKGDNKLSVLDTYSNGIIDTLPIQTTAELIAVSRYGGYIVYAKRGGKTIYLMNLETYDTESIPTDKGIEQLGTDSNGQWIIYATKDDVYQVSRKTKKVVQKLPVSGQIGLTFTPDGDGVIVAELDNGRIFQMSFADTDTDKPVKGLATLEQKISPVSIMPDGQALFFNGRNRIHRYDLATNEIIRSNIEISAQGYRPYLTGDNRQLFVIGTENNQPTLFVLNPNDVTIVNKYPLPDVEPITENTSVLASGWLDQVAIVAGKDKVHLVDVSTGEIKSIALSGKINEMVVQSDSKVLLLSIENKDKKQANFVTIDLLQRQIRTASVLDNIIPNNIVMGQTNTLCH
ncbi:MAG: hypothetical protein KGV56_04960 [Gammaproteobacteria bacterium]|nr:hypothetical protein [Gammaproteobacteria bacterium]